MLRQNTLTIGLIGNTMICHIPSNSLTLACKFSFSGEQKLNVRQNEEVLLNSLYAVTQMSVFGLTGYYQFPANKVSWT